MCGAQFLFSRSPRVPVACGATCRPRVLPLFTAAMLLPWPTSGLVGARTCRALRQPAGHVFRGRQSARERKDDRLQLQLPSRCVSSV